MRVAFFGTPAYAVPSLDALVEAGHEVVGVVARPDRPAGRGQRLRSPPTVVRARELGLAVLQPRALRRGPFPERLAALDPEIGVVVAYGRILPPALLATPARGCLNAHASLLPRWRGAAPIERAIMAGDARTGVCIMQMDEGLDTGPVLRCREVEIGPDETAPELRERLSALSARLLVESLERLDTLEPRPQPEEGVTLAPPLGPGDRPVDWTRPARAIHDQVRALTPRPGALARLGERPLKLLRTRLAEGSGPPGEVLESRRRLVVACGQGAVEILQAQLPGRPGRTGREIAQGARLRPGDRLLTLAPGRDGLHPSPREAACVRPSSRPPSCRPTSPASPRRSRPSRMPTGSTWT